MITDKQNPTLIRKYPEEDNWKEKNPNDVQLATWIFLRLDVCGVPAEYPNERYGLALFLNVVHEEYPDLDECHYLLKLAFNAGIKFLIKTGCENYLSEEFRTIYKDKF